MSRKTTSASGDPDREALSRQGSDSRRSRQFGHRALQILVGRRDESSATPSAPVVTCPDCGAPSRDPVEAQYGYCPQCRGFTGLCGAGRKVVCPDILTKTSWHIPCTNIGTIAWEIVLDKSPCVTLLCRGHDLQVRTGGATWIKRARRLTSQTGQEKSPIFRW